MRLVQLRAEDPQTGVVAGWRKHSSIQENRQSATTYNAMASLLKGLESAEERWPQYRWRAIYWGPAEREMDLPARPRPVKTYSEAEVWALVLKEREGCAAVCEDEERIRTEAGKKHPEESAPRDRCFSAARAAINCAKGIRSERPHSLKELLCETSPSTR